ncbi:MAG: HAD family phosphatase [Planctomycetaceae bacterium]|nr:HAD family phosphatase [Planctomycetaceae bacterium]
MTEVAFPPVRAVVFDMDGLMFNTEVVFNASGTELLRRRGKSPHPELFLRMMGRRAPDAFAVMMELMELTEPYEVLKQESESIFFEMLDEIVAPMPGLFTLLDRIEAAGLPKGVATSSTRKYLGDMLARFDLTHRFDVTLGAEDVTHGKPDPEIYLTAARRLDIDPAAMMVLEDSEAGTRAAAAAGAQIISVPHEHCSGHDYSMAVAVASRLDDPVVLNRIGPECSE